MIKTLLNVSTVSCKLYSMFEADVMYPFFHAKPSYFQLNINKVYLFQNSLVHVHV